MSSSPPSPTSTSVLDDPARLAELEATGLLDSPTEASFDRITRLAQRILDVPVALVSLVDRDRQFFKSQVGLQGAWAEDRESPIRASFCQYAVATGDRLVVEDAREHRVLRHNPAIEEQDVIAYAGEPLATSGGHVLGTLCVIDNESRRWQAWELEILSELSALATTEIDYRLRTRALAELETAAASIQAPLRSLGEAVRGLVSVAANAEDGRLRRLTSAARDRLVELEHSSESLQEIATHRQAEGAVAMELCERLDRAVRVATASLQDDDLTVDIRRRPVPVAGDPYEVERALSQLILGALQHAAEDRTVGVVLDTTEGTAVLDVASPGARMPVSELTRIVARFDKATAGDAVGPTDRAPASVAARGGTTTAEQGPARGTTGPEGTQVQVVLPLLSAG